MSTHNRADAIATTLRRLADEVDQLHEDILLLRSRGAIIANTLRNEADKVARLDIADP